MLSGVLAETADGERLLIDEQYDLRMRKGSLRLLRAIENAQGKYTPAPIFAHPKARPSYVPVADRPMVIPFESRGKAIIRRAAYVCRMDYADVVGRRRSRPFVLARIIAAKILREQTGANGFPRYSLPQIGKMLGGRDHSSICYLLSVFEPYCRTHEGMRAAYEKAKEEL